MPLNTQENYYNYIGLINRCLHNNCTLITSYDHSKISIILSTLTGINGRNNARSLQSNQFNLRSPFANVFIIVRAVEDTGVPPSKSPLHGAARALIVVNDNDECRIPRRISSDANSKPRLPPFCMSQREWNAVLSG